MGLLSVGVGGTIFVLWSHPAWTGDGSWALAALSCLILGLLGVLSIACFVVAGVGPKRARVLQTMLALAFLMTFPIGTVYSVYALWVCWGGGREDAARERHVVFGVPSAAW